jgi:hypothetical protein
MGGITHCGFMLKKDGVSMVWRKLWFEVKGTRLTYFQRDGESSSLFNRSVSKRGQIKLEEVDDVRRSQASDAESTEIEILDSHVRTHRLAQRHRAAAPPPLRRRRHAPRWGTRLHFSPAAHSARARSGPTGCGAPTTRR